MIRKIKPTETSTFDQSVENLAWDNNTYISTR